MTLKKRLAAIEARKRTKKGHATEWVQTFMRSLYAPEMEAAEATILSIALRNNQINSITNSKGFVYKGEHYPVQAYDTALGHYFERQLTSPDLAPELHEELADLLKDLKYSSLQAKQIQLMAIELFTSYYHPSAIKKLLPSNVFSHLFNEIADYPGIDAGLQQYPSDADVIAFREKHKTTLEEIDKLLIRQIIFKT